MMEKRIFVCHANLSPDLLQQIKEMIPDWEVYTPKEEEQLKEATSKAEIILHWKKEMEPQVRENQHVKWIQSWSAGVNSLPLKMLEEKGIHLTSANGVHAYPISETIFALLLSWTRKIDAYVRQQQEKKWHHAGLKLELHKKTIGIIGVGEIGLETAKIAKAFDMKVLGVRYSGKAADFVDEMFTPDQLQEVLQQSDYIVITLPLTEETKHMFTAKEFGLMKKSAFLVNIGRGQIIKENDLIKALEQQEIAGAGLDVFSEEPLSENSPLWGMENVIITPHTSGATEHYDERVIKNIVLPNLRNYIDGGKPSINLVNYQRGY